MVFFINHKNGQAISAGKKKKTLQENMVVFSELQVPKHNLIQHCSQKETVVIVKQQKQPLFGSNCMTTSAKKENIRFTISQERLCNLPETCSTKQDLWLTGGLTRG